MLFYFVQTNSLKRSNIFLEDLLPYVLWRL